MKHHTLRTKKKVVDATCRNMLMQAIKEVHASSGKAMAPTLLNDLMAAQSQVPYLSAPHLDLLGSKA